MYFTSLEEHNFFRIYLFLEGFCHPGDDHDVIKIVSFENRVEKQ